MDFGNRWLLMAGVTALAAVGSMWLPWFRSGQSMRSSFSAFRAAQLLGIEWITPLRVLWFLVPVVLILSLGLWLTGLPSVSAFLLIFIGLFLALGGGLFVAIAGPEVGSAAATSTGLCSSVFAGMALKSQRSRAG